MNKMRQNWKDRKRKEKRKRAGSMMRQSRNETAKRRDEREGERKRARGDKVTRKNGAEERCGKKEKVKEKEEEEEEKEEKEDEGRGAAGGDGRLVPLAPDRTPSVVILRGSLARFRGKKVVGDERAAERGPPEFPR